MPVIILVHAESESPICLAEVMAVGMPNKLSTVRRRSTLARTGRPGPVLIDVPKDVQQQLAVPDWDVPMAISGYMQRLPQMPSTGVGHSS